MKCEIYKRDMKNIIWKLTQPFYGYEFNFCSVEHLNEWCKIKIKEHKEMKQNDKKI